MGFAPGSGSRRVDHGVAGGEVAGFEPGDGGPPTVGKPADQPQHPGLERADPDADVVHRHRPAEGARQPVVLALEPRAAMLTGVPQLADHANAFLESLHTVAPIEARAAHRLDRVPGDARAGPQRQTEDVGCQSHATGPRGHEGHQGQAVQCA